MIDEPIVASDASARITRTLISDGEVDWTWSSATRSITGPLSHRVDHLADATNFKSFSSREIECFVAHMRNYTLAASNVRPLLVLEEMLCTLTPCISVIFSYLLVGDPQNSKSIKKTHKIQKNIKKYIEFTPQICFPPEPGV